MSRQQRLDNVALVVMTAVFGAGVALAAVLVLAGAR